MRLISYVVMLGLMAGCFPSLRPDLEAKLTAIKLVDQGVLHLRSGDLDRADANFGLSIQLINNSAALDGLGCVALLRGEFQLAEKYFIAAYDLDPNYSYSLGNLALLYEVAGQHETALKVHERAIDENPRVAQFRNNYAAFLHDYVNAGNGEPRVKQELLKAEALARHPIIKLNMGKIK